MPSYLSSTLHVNLLHSVLYSSVPWLFATFTDLVFGGWLVNALIHRGRNASLVRQVVLVTGTAFGLGIFGAAHAHTATTAIFWISVSLGGLAAAAPVGWSIPSLIAPEGSVGTLGGILNFGNQLSAIAAPIVTGYVVAATHEYAWAFVVATAFLMQASPVTSSAWVASNQYPNHQLRGSSKPMSHQLVAVDSVAAAFRRAALLGSCRSRSTHRLLHRRKAQRRRCGIS